MSRRRSLYEWLAILLLLSASTLGIVLFGAVRYWFAAPLMVLVFAGVALYLARPLLDEECRALKVPPGGLVFLLFLLYTAILIPFSSVPYEAKVELLKVASYVGAYFAWTELASRFGRWRMLLGAVVLLGTVIALYAWVLHAKESTAVLHLQRDPGYGMRASGTFMAPAHLGAYMGTMVCVSLALIWMTSAGAFLRLLSGYGLILFLPTLLLSGSRSGWFGTLLGMPVVLLMVAWRRSKRWFVITLVTFPVAAAAVLAILWFTVPMFHERVDSGLNIEGSAAWRLIAWQDTWEMIQDEPVLGFGPGSYRWRYATYQSWWANRWLRYAHNEYLHCWAEYGAVGLFLAAAFVLTIVISLLRLYAKAESDRDACCAAGFMGALVAALGHAVFDFNLHVFSLVHLLVLVGGVTMSGFFRIGALKERALPLGAWVGISGVGLLLTGWLAFSAAQVSASNILTRVAEDKLEDVNLLNAAPYAAIEKDLRRAVRLDPSNWWPYLELGNIQRRQAFWIRDEAYRREKAELSYAFYRQALDRNPYDMNAVYGVARCYYLMGDQETSITYLQRAVAHWPSNPEYAKQLGLQLRELNRLEEALEAFRLARRADGGRDPTLHAHVRALERELQGR